MDKKARAHTVIVCLVGALSLACAYLLGGSMKYLRGDVSRFWTSSRMQRHPAHSSQPVVRTFTDADGYTCLDQAHPHTIVIDATRVRVSVQVCAQRRSLAYKVVKNSVYDPLSIHLDPTMLVLRRGKKTVRESTPPADSPGVMQSALNVRDTLRDWFYTFWKNVWGSRWGHSVVPIEAIICVPAQHNVHNLKVRVKDSSLRLEGIEVRFADVYAHASELKLNGVRTDRTLLHTTDGDTQCSRCVLSDAHLYTDRGTLSFDGTLQGNSEIGTRTGTVVARFTERQSYYALSVFSGHGAVYINDQRVRKTLGTCLSTEGSAQLCVRNERGVLHVYFPQ
ncbi:DUF4097 family beta strand repeat-containing protein [Treponema pallidum]|uniref:DUF4097 family beta strand repeat-containing protein n=1 Tax=Treponema pallidum TaxID=160 RepID=UPI00200332CD|nr:DUF4097 family beta strand repeat-containing protein [Treponema pallidum]UPN52949.1 putative lipoprotein [Treponema pallidum subsp. endemicum]